MKTIVSVGQSIDKVLDICNRTGDADVSSRLYGEAATQYMRLCSMHPFDTLRRTKEYASSDDRLLPANVCDVRWIVDENDVVYTKRDAGPVSTGARKFVLNTITSIPSSAGLPFTSDDCVVSTGDNSFTSALLAQAILDSKIPDGIAVTGTGVINGTYTLAGTMNSKPYYELESGGVTGRIFYSTSLGAWAYAESSTGYTEKYGVISEEDLPDTSGYVTIPGGASTDIALTYTESTGITAVGEYVKIGDNDELFEITAESGTTFTIDRTYRASSLTAGTIYVRPPIAQEVELYDENGEAVTDVAFTVYYWIIPPALHRSTDILMLPSSHALELLLLRSSPEAKEKRPVSSSEIDAAIADLKRMNPDHIPTIPKQHGFAGIGDMDTGTVYGGTR